MIFVDHQILELKNKHFEEGLAGVDMTCFFFKKLVQNFVKNSNSTEYGGKKDSRCNFKFLATWV